MEEFMSPPLLLSGLGAATVVIGTVLIYFEGWLGGDDE